jgi:hypothetical protein
VLKRTVASAKSLVNNNILSFILVVMRNYLAAALYPSVPDIYKVQQYIK